MQNFVVHSNESMCRKCGRLGMEQVSSIVSDLSSYTEFEEDKIISYRNKNEMKTSKSMIDSVFTCTHGMRGRFDIVTA